MHPLYGTLQALSKCQTVNIIVKEKPFATINLHIFKVPQCFFPHFFLQQTKMWLWAATFVEGIRILFFSLITLHTKNRYGYAMEQSTYLTDPAGLLCFYVVTNAHTLKSPFVPQDHSLTNGGERLR